MTITLNGERREIAGAKNVRELLDELQLPPHALLVEHNGKALRKEEWRSSELRDADRIEIIRIVAGG
ncbi:MAG: sulfur carrier protein [Chthoniobacter sp.]|nr:sulfur carrier protein [Chthoniobacter sp.]